jgi:hypothetical protein
MAYYSTLIHRLAGKPGHKRSPYMRLVSDGRSLFQIRLVQSREPMLLQPNFNYSGYLRLLKRNSWISNADLVELQTNYVCVGVELTHL